MKSYEILAAIYEAWKLSEETPLQCFLRLDRKAGMKGVSRDKFEKLWDLCAKYPAKHKLDVITARQTELRNEITESMLRVDPPWPEVVEWCQLTKDAQESPRGLPMALEALSAVQPEVASEYQERCKVEFPDVFGVSKPTAEDDE